MSQHSPDDGAMARIDDCIPAYPLGRPTDRERYSMTPPLARLYRRLAEHRAVHGELPSMSALGSTAPIFYMFQRLMERGWLKKIGHRYDLVEPVMRFPKVPG